MEVQISRICHPKVTVKSFHDVVKLLNDTPRELKIAVIDESRDLSHNAISVLLNKARSRPYLLSRNFLAPKNK